MSKEKIFKGHYNLASGKQADEMVVRHMTWVLNAMQEYADQQTKELQERVEDMKHTLENDVIHINKLQAKIDELEKALETASNKIIDYSSCLTSIQDSINNTLTN